jgi:hypothetical protein
MMTTSHPEYSWLNPLQIWAPGTVDLRTGASAPLPRGYARLPDLGEPTPPNSAELSE